jgi:hypothetical protein
MPRRLHQGRRRRSGRIWGPNTSPLNLTAPHNVRLWQLADLDAHAEQCPFSGVNRTSQIRNFMSAHDPKRTSPLVTQDWPEPASLPTTENEIVSMPTSPCGHSRGICRPWPRLMRIARSKALISSSVAIHWRQPTLLISQLDARRRCRRASAHKASIGSCGR